MKNRMHLKTLFSILFCLALSGVDDCPKDGHYVGICEPCLYLSQCTETPISTCDTGSHLCVADHSSSCPGAETSGCDASTCSESSANYPYDCSCTNSLFPDNWVDCSETSIPTTSHPTKAPSLSDCPDGHFLSECQQCVWTAQCGTSLSCDSSLKLCVQNDGSSACSSTSARCKSPCPETEANYPQSCAGQCTNSFFPDAWVDCSAAKTSTKIPSKTPTVHTTQSPASINSTVLTTTTTNSSTTADPKDSGGSGSGIQLSTFDKILLGALLFLIIACCCMMWIFRKGIVLNISYGGSSKDKTDRLLENDSAAATDDIIYSGGKSPRITTQNTPSRSFLKRMVKSLEGYDEPQQPSINEFS